MESGIDEDGSASIPGGIPGSRRGSKLNDFLEMKKRKPPKRAYKDKQGMYENCKSDILNLIVNPSPGFVWRRMVHDTDDYLSAPRPPSLGQGAAYTGDPSSLSSTPLPPSLFPSDTSSSRKISIISNRSEPANPRIPPEGDNASMTSFKTCPSDSNINSLVVPRQVPANETYYNKPPIPMPVIKAPAPASAIPIGAGPAHMSVMSKSTPQANNPQVPIRSAATAPAPPPTNANSAPPADPLVGGVRHLVRDR